LENTGLKKCVNKFGKSFPQFWENCVEKVERNQQTLDFPTVNKRFSVDNSVQNVDYSIKT